MNDCKVAGPSMPSPVMTTMNCAVGGFDGSAQATEGDTWNVKRSLGGLVEVAPEAIVP